MDDHPLGSPRANPLQPFQGESKYPKKTYLEANTKLWHIRKSIFICKFLESYQEKFMKNWHHICLYLQESPNTTNITGPRRREATNSRASHLCERYHCDACDLNLSRSPWKAQLLSGWATVPKTHANAQTNLRNDITWVATPAAYFRGDGTARIQQIHVIESDVIGFETTQETACITLYSAFVAWSCSWTVHSIHECLKF